MAKDGSSAGTVPWGLPLLLTGYLETLRIAVFYAFGWERSGILIGISLLISMNTCRQAFKSSRAGNISTLTMVAMLTTIAALPAGQMGGLGTTFTSGIRFPAELLSSSNGLYGGLLDSAVLASYGVLVYFIGSFILERKSAREIFVLGAFLSLSAAAASDQGISIYLILNLVFAFGLQSQLHLLGLQFSSGVRGVEHSGINGRFWNGTALAVILVSVSVAVLIPAAKGVTGGWEFLRQETGKAYSGGRTGAASDFWRRLKNFDFNGNVPLDDNPVLMVKADVPSYWRGEAADFYTGSGWQNSMVIRAVNKNDYLNHYLGIFPVKKTKQEFTFLPGFGSEVVYYAGSPTAVAVPDSNLAADDSGNFYNRRFASEMTYKVVSDVVDFRPDRLRSVSGEYPPEILEKYLQLPRIPGRVRELAQTLTAKAPTPYEKAKKLEAYLSSNYPYDTKVIPATEKQDVVDYFLFDLKKGYCTYHSTAMAVMLRSIGIPSRWVTGFTAGSFSKEKGAYIVTMRDAHAWVEAYIPGAGWVPFEPTSSFVIPSSDKPVQALSDSSESVKIPGNKSHFNGIPIIGIFLASVLLLLGFWGIHRTKAKGNDEKFDVVEQIYEGFLKLIAQKGYYKSADQTPLEFAAYLCGMESFSGCSGQIMYVTDAYLRHRFSLDRLSVDETKELERVLKNLSGHIGVKSRD